MVFSSLLFIYLFLPLNLILYYSTTNNQLRNFILVVFSLVFYAWGEPIWISLLIFSAFIDYANGIFIEKYRNKRIAYLGIVSTLVFNLGLLLTFKYADFIVENVNFIIGTNFSKPGILLPIGISFYTFQTISYTIDVYRGEIKAQKNFMNFLMFVSLYHQLVAGPIVRYSQINDQINFRQVDWNLFNTGVLRFAKGLFKKVFIANGAGAVAAHFLSMDFQSQTTLGGWWGIIMYTIQIYFDFSGYSDMAIGLGKMFGFHYGENFDHPYISRSITEFWRRWHISLGTFFRDYLYIPLGGNKKSVYRNLFIVWFCTGLWHGASWNFILWGLYFFLLIIAEKVFLGGILKKLKIFSHLYTMFFIILGWSLFYFTDLNTLSQFLSSIFGISGQQFYDIEFINSLTTNLWWFLFSVILCFPVYNFVMSRVNKLYNGPVVEIINLILVFFFMSVSTIQLVGSTYNPFIYFRF